jgi:hypothetical protein
MEIPEILQAIGKYMRTGTQLVVMGVSKMWQENLAPEAWKEVGITYYSLDRVHLLTVDGKALQWKSFQKHRQHVRRVRMKRIDGFSGYFLASQ